MTPQNPEHIPTALQSHHNTTRSFEIFEKPRQLLPMSKVPHIIVVILFCLTYIADN